MTNKERAESAFRMWRLANMKRVFVQVRDAVKKMDVEELENIIKGVHYDGWTSGRRSIERDD